MVALLCEPDRPAPSLEHGTANRKTARAKESIAVCVCAVGLAAWTNNDTKGSPAPRRVSCWLNTPCRHHQEIAPRCPFGIPHASRLFLLLLFCLSRARCSDRSTESRKNRGRAWTGAPTVAHGRAGGQSNADGGAGTDTVGEDRLPQWLDASAAGLLSH